MLARGRCSAVTPGRFVAVSKERTAAVLGYDVFTLASAGIVIA